MSPVCSVASARISRTRKYIRFSLARISLIRSMTYTYDNQYRLTSETWPSSAGVTGETRTYTFDLAGTTSALTPQPNTANLTKLRKLGQYLRRKNPVPQLDGGMFSLREQRSNYVEA